MFSSASSISGLTIASTSSFHGPGQPRASNSSAPPLESLSRFTPLTVNQAYAQRVPKHRSHPVGRSLAFSLLRQRSQLSRPILGGVQLVGSSSDATALAAYRQLQEKCASILQRHIAGRGRQIC